MEGAKRALAGPINPKEPVSLQSVQELAEQYNTPNATLEQLRLLFIVIVGYAGMMRVGELLAIKRKDVTIDSDRMAIFLSKRKNDQYREGHTVNFRKSGKITCPVSITSKLLSFLPNSSDSSYPIIRRIISSKKGNYFHCRLGISSSCVRGVFKKHLSPLVSDISCFGTHSLKSGSA